MTGPALKYVMVQNYIRFGLSVTSGIATSSALSVAYSDTYSYLILEHVMLNQQIVSRMLDKILFSVIILIKLPFQ